ncbi:MAG: SEC-C metal-binding domain-containing protein [Bacteroidota bacterium]
MCWNLALLPESKQEEMLAKMRSALNMDDAEFADFREEVIAPMILRHHKMFPNISRQYLQTSASAAPNEKKYPGTGRNEPCPCNSGKKYKWCCGR